MKYRKPEELKQTDVDWLDKVPTEWEEVKIKFLSDVNPRKSKVVLDTDSEVTYLPMEALGEFGGMDRSQTKRLSEVYDGYTYFQDGDVLSAKITPCFENGKSAIAGNLVNEVGFGTTEIHVLRPRENVLKEILFYNLISHHYLKLGEASMYGAGGQKRVSTEFLEEFRIPLPPKPEQRSIVAFLGRKTEAIDGLIQMKEQLIERLKEKRQALITRAVTKGLDPDVQMKDSGIEWLGEIPEEWDVAKLKFLSVVKRGASPRPIDDQKYFDENGEYAWVRISDVTASHKYLENTEQTLSELGASKSVKLEPGELILSIAASVGKPIINRIKCCIHDGFIYFKNLQLDTKYAYYLFASGEPYKGLGKLGTQLNLNSEIVGSIQSPIPSKAEQVEIADNLDRKTKALDETIRKTEKVIEKLKEYRQSLISAAVTGKIDVRSTYYAKASADRDEAEVETI